MDAAAGRKGFAEGFDLHENRLRTACGAVKRTPTGADIGAAGRQPTGAREREDQIQRPPLRASLAAMAAPWPPSSEFGGAEVDKLANARSPSAAPTPATRAARIGRAGRAW